MWLDTFWWKKHIATVKLQMCFLFVYLLKYKIVIIKANTIIVSTTKANKSKYIISNKNASIIAPPIHNKGLAFVMYRWQTTSAYSHFL